MAKNIKHILTPEQQLDFERLSERILLHFDIHQGGIFILGVDSEKTHIILENELKRRLRHTAWEPIDLSRVNDPLVEIVTQKSDIGKNVKPVVFSLNFLPVHQSETSKSIWQSINYRREYIFSYNLMLILWMYEEQIDDIQRFAKDFWSFRTSVHFFSAKEILPTMADLKSDQQVLEKISEIQELLNEVKRKPDKNETLLANLYFRLAGLFYQVSDFSTALEYYKKSIDLYQKTKNERNLCAAQSHIGLVYYATGELDDALAAFQQALAGFQKIGDLAGAANQLIHIGKIYQDRGDLDQALDLYQQSLEIQKKAEDIHLKGTIFNNLGQIYFARGDFDTALSYLEQSLDIRRQIGDLAGKAETNFNIAQIYEARGDIQTAISLVERSIAIQSDAGQPDMAAKMAYLDKLKRLRYHGTR